MIEIDGSLGEGGGQIIRTSLTLALATGEPFRIVNIRAGRRRPGLLRQHLTAVRAAAEIGGAQTEGAELHSRELTFHPGPVRGGDYHFDVGTAGSATLVLQTILPVLMTAEASSTLTLEGGTHNPFAPPYDFLEKTFVPLINQLGPRVKLTLDRPGFYPAGGGIMRVTIEPAEALERLELVERGPVREISARATVANLPRHIAERELKVIGRAFSLSRKQLEIVEETRSPGPGNVVCILLQSDFLCEVVTAFGERGIRAEQVARKASREAKEYLQGEVPVGTHLADQLLVPLALGSGGSFLTLPPSQHTLTNGEILQRFLDVEIICAEQADGRFLITVSRDRKG